MSAPTYQSGLWDGTESYGNATVVDLSARYFIDSARRQRIDLSVQNLFDLTYATRLSTGTRDLDGSNYTFWDLGLPRTLRVAYTYGFLFSKAPGTDTERKPVAVSAVNMPHGWARAAVRYLYLTHRYLGIAVSVLMLIWCLSGVVMMYVSFPSLPETMRTAALPELQLQGCCRAASLLTALDPDGPLSNARIEMLAGRPVIAVASGFGDTQLLDLISGTALAPIGASEAATVADAFAQRWGLPHAYASVQMLSSDQWTVSEEFARARPLYKFSWADAGASQLYVSSVSGRAVQFTTEPLRFWNWLGAVPHWLYFSQLRRHAGVWAQIIIYSSLLGCLLTVTGIYIGVRQYVRRPPDRLSPYRGFMFWHHLPGLIFGVFALSWVLSGLLSMNPWGLLEGGGASVERQRLSATTPSWSQVRLSLASISKRPDLGNLVSLQTSSLDGRLYFIATKHDGARIRLNADGRMVALSPTDLQREAHLLGAPSQLPTLMTKADSFYFSHHSDPVSFPVYRVVLDDPQRTRYYLDPISGAILRKVDQGARDYRWLHEGLHRLDFATITRARPIWDFLMIVLLLGVSCICLTGCYSALLRVSGQRRSTWWRSDSERP